MFGIATANSQRTIDLNTCPAWIARATIDFCRSDMRSGHLGNSLSWKSPMPLRELAAAWVRANFPFPTVQTEFLQHLDRAMKRGVSCSFRIGSLLTKNRKPFIIYCFRDEFFAFEITVEQAARLKLEAGELLSAESRRQEQPHRRLSRASGWKRLSSTKPPRSTGLCPSKAPFAIGPNICSSNRSNFASSTSHQDDRVLPTRIFYCTCSRPRALCLSQLLRSVICTIKPNNHSLG